MNKLILVIIGIFTLSGCGTFNFSGSASGSVNVNMVTPNKGDVIITQDGAIVCSKHRYNVLTENNDA